MAATAAPTWCSRFLGQDKILNPKHRLHPLERQLVMKISMEKTLQYAPRPRSDETRNGMSATKCQFTRWFGANSFVNHVIASTAAAASERGFGDG